jgi:hypothetical protein
MKTRIIDHPLNAMRYATVKRKRSRHGLKAGTRVELTTSVYTTNGHNRIIEGSFDGNLYDFAPCDLNF